MRRAAVDEAAQPDRLDMGHNSLSEMYCIKDSVVIKLLFEICPPASSDTGVLVNLSQILR